MHTGCVTQWPCRLQLLHMVWSLSLAQSSVQVIFSAMSSDPRLNCCDSSCLPRLSLWRIAFSVANPSFLSCLLALYVLLAANTDDQQKNNTNNRSGNNIMSNHQMMMQEGILLIWGTRTRTRDGRHAAPHNSSSTSSLRSDKVLVTLDGSTPFV